MSQRKAFNFYRSYYDVFKELSKKDKLDFIEALLDRQFTGLEPKNLDGMAKFAYISQKSNIDSQIKGWEDKTRCKLDSSDPTQGGAQRGILTPTAQVKEEGKGKGKGKGKGEEEDEGEKKEEYKYTLEREVLNSVAKLFDAKYYSEPKQKQKWLDTIRLLIQIDKEDHKSIVDVIKFARTDDFWCSNLLSISGIRKKNDSGVSKFDQIKAKMIKNPANKSAFDNF